jgi:hypothetical protein
MSTAYPVIRFADLASMTLEEIKADFAYSIKKEMEYRELGQWAEAGGVRAEVRTAYLAWAWKNVRACSRRTNACLAAMKSAPVAQVRLAA